MILPSDATYAEFREYVERQRGPVSCVEMDDLWDWRQKLLGIRVATGRAERDRLPPDEQHLTMREREKKIIAEAQAAGITVERAPA